MSVTRGQATQQQEHDLHVLLYLYSNGRGAPSPYIPPAESHPADTTCIQLDKAYYTRCHKDTYETYEVYTRRHNPTHPLVGAAIGYDTRGRSVPMRLR
jgi:hypothetical protein